MHGKIAVVGIGLMGGNMARRLHESGCEVTGYDLSQESVTALRADGLEATNDLAHAVGDADVIVCSLPNSQIVRTAWMAEGGVLAHAKPGALVVEMSSIDPDTMKDLAAACAESGLRPLDVPVSGGPAEARAGSLVLLVGGAEADIDAARPVLELLGASLLHTGDVGTAKVVKLVNNVMTMGNVLVASEAFAMGTRAGVDPERLYDVLSQSGGRSHHFTKRFPNALKRNYDPGFKMQLGEKDVALAVEVARGLGQPMPMASLVREMYQMALGLGYRDRDIVALLDMYQRIGDGTLGNGPNTGS
ncbi:NAD-binding protein [Pseudooceanicola sp. 216_PA32_1]|uniref:NAD-binding protein n=1 Tax=Pseudooceanicola pacificus TaxID=2676438 RepID=A0A844W876_9RHOB|nr:NAD(P)-dependent oxidoreductase [Pseudooceanicola pacificus]MWB79345.1 NAD-binding protein [Pseudooceanicola pacificus]